MDPTGGWTRVLPCSRRDRLAVTAQEPPMVIRLRSDLDPSRSNQFECAHVVGPCVLGAQQIKIPFGFANNSAKINPKDRMPNINSFNLWPTVPKDHGA